MDDRFNTLLIYLRTSIRRINQIFDEEFIPFGLNASQLPYMMLLKDSVDGISMSELTRLIMVDKALTTRVIKELEEKSYIYRDKVKISSRNYKIKLTDKGLEVACAIENIFTGKCQDFFKKFTTAEQKQLEESFNLIIEKLDF